jgi:hypothetical protein
MAAHKKLGKLGKMLARLERDQNFARLSATVGNWLGNEAENSGNKETLSKLVAELKEGETRRQLIVTLAQNLKDKNYVPPKKVVQGQLNLEHGRQIWLKPKFIEQYTAVLSPDALENLFVDKVDGGKVVVSVGNPDKEPVTIKHLVPKIALRVTQAAA